MKLYWLFCPLFYCDIADKELIDEHTAAIDELRNRPIGGGGGDGVDMNALYNVFASKNPPDNTIKRIEALEAKVADLDGFKDQATQQLAKHTSDIASLQGLQDILNQHDARIKALENMEAPTVSGDLDTDAILKQVNLVKSELS